MSKEDLVRKHPEFPHQVIELTLPLAPSVNHLYMFKRGKRFMTKDGLNYMSKASQMAMKAVNLQNYIQEEPGVWLVCEIKYYFPDKRRRDCHNMHKVIMDALEYTIFTDDRWVMVRDMYVGLDKENPRLEIRIYPYLNAEDYEGRNKWLNTDGTVDKTQ